MTIHYLKSQSSEVHIFFFWIVLNRANHELNQKWIRQHNTTLINHRFKLNVTDLIISNSICLLILINLSIPFNIFHIFPYAWQDTILLTQFPWIFFFFLILLMTLFNAPIQLFQMMYDAIIPTCSSLLYI